MSIKISIKPPPNPDAPRLCGLKKIFRSPVKSWQPMAPKTSHTITIAKNDRRKPWQTPRQELEERPHLRQKNRPKYDRLPHLSPTHTTSPARRRGPSSRSQRTCASRQQRSSIWPFGTGVAGGTLTCCPDLLHRRCTLTGGPALQRSSGAGCSDHGHPAPAAWCPGLPPGGRTIFPRRCGAGRPIFWTASATPSLPRVIDIVGGWSPFWGPGGSARTPKAVFS